MVDVTKMKIEEIRPGMSVLYRLHDGGYQRWEVKAIVRVEWYTRAIHMVEVYGCARRFHARELLPDTM